MAATLRLSQNRPRDFKNVAVTGVLAARSCMASWAVKTGAALNNLPDRYSSYQTCYRHLPLWLSSGVMEGILRALVADIGDQRDLDLTERLIEGYFVPAEKPNGANAHRSWSWQTALVFLLPFPQQVLRRKKSYWMKGPRMIAFCRNCPPPGRVITHIAELRSTFVSESWELTDRPQT